MSVNFIITPVDTLFFRGNQPMSPGQALGRELFPPPLSVLYGAIRTEYLKQHGISFSRYKNNDVSETVLNDIGPASAGQPAFCIQAVLLRQKETVYVPFPSHWHVDFQNKDDMQGPLVIAEPIDTAVKEKLNMQCSIDSPPWGKISTHGKSYPNHWMPAEMLTLQSGQKVDRKQIKPLEHFYKIEVRTGISLLDKETGKPTRKAQEGQIYTGKHIRLIEDTDILIVLDRNPGLTKDGFMYLGGERRVVSYSVTEGALLPPGKGPQFMALGPVLQTQESISKLVSSSGPAAVAGWDMAKQFHKPSAAYYPAGAIFQSNINNQCIEIM